MPSSPDERNEALQRLTSAGAGPEEKRPRDPVLADVRTWLVAGVALLGLRWLMAGSFDSATEAGADLSVAAVVLGLLHVAGWFCVVVSAAGVGVRLALRTSSLD
ncbi:hypothetical protein [Nocardioides bruguierae]|uniref:hypothetical protein n=1 Tax=Nocardioides bruguierae TaxID=2945102 RepID=UPI002020E238|nr:hypothetical protein [Nocardioides bruguierae]MCL8024323.1 hypothetical protein [Nocardioides bruguierae]